MSFAVAAALLVMGSGPIEVVSNAEASYNIGYEELVAGDPAGALEVLEAQSGADAQDPARLINHGVALARLGQHEGARDRFQQAARLDDRYRLETADGSWVDSRVLARRGLAMIDEGHTTGFAALASR